MKYLRCCRRNTSTQARSGVAPRAVQGANQSTARPFLSTDGEILAPFGASCDRADSAIFLALSTSEQVTIICELPYLKQAAGRPVLFGSRDDAAFLLKCFRCGTFNRFTYRSHTAVLGNFSSFQPAANLLWLDKAFHRTARASQYNNHFEFARSRLEVTNRSSPRSTSKPCCEQVGAWVVRLPPRPPSRFGRRKAQGL